MKKDTNQKDTLPTAGDKQLYVNKHANDFLSAIEFHKGEDEHTYAVFSGKKGDSTDVLQQRISELFPKINILSATTESGKPILFTRGLVGQEQITSTIKEAIPDSNFVQDKPVTSKKRRFTNLEKITIFGHEVDTMKARGWVGNIGQILLYASGHFAAIRDSSRAASHKKKQAATAISLFANGINSVVGSPKVWDETRLEAIKQATRGWLSSTNVMSGALPSETVKALVTRGVEKSADSKTPSDRAKSFLYRNASPISDGLKLFGKKMLEEAGKELGNQGIKMSGTLSQTAKIISLASKDADPYGLEKGKGTIGWLREQFWLSGALEWLSNLALMFGSIYKNDDKKIAQIKAAKAASLEAAEKTAQLHKTLKTENRAANSEETKQLSKFAEAIGRNKHLNVSINGKTLWPRKFHNPFTGKEINLDWKLFSLKTSTRLTETKDPNSPIMVDWLQLAASITICFSLAFKAMAPLRIKKLHMDEYVAYVSSCLALTPENDRTESLANAVREMTQLKIFPEAKKLGQAKLFAMIAEDFERNYNMPIDRAQNSTNALAKNNAVHKGEVSPPETPESATATKDFDTARPTAHAAAVAKQGHDGSKSLVEKVTQPVLAEAGVSMMPA